MKKGRSGSVPSNRASGIAHSPGTGGVLVTPRQDASELDCPKSANRAQQAVHALLTLERHLQIDGHRPVRVGHFPHTVFFLSGFYSRQAEKVPAGGQARFIFAGEQVVSQFLNLTF
jgi:hypothetical protein